MIGFIMAESAYNPNVDTALSAGIIAGYVIGSIVGALVVACIFGAICRMIAETRGVSKNTGFILGFFLGAIGLIIICFMSPDQKSEQTSIPQNRASENPQMKHVDLSENEYWMCENCYTKNPSDAKYCKNCGAAKEYIDDITK